MATAEKTYVGLTLRNLADKSEGERVRLLRVPPIAVTVDPDTGDMFFDPTDATRILFNPATPGYEHEPWPFAGKAFVGDPAPYARIPTTTVADGVSQDWLTLEGERIVHRPGGPPDNLWKVTHTFRHADAIVFHTADGDVRYRVVENPDKWPAEKNERDEGWGGEVRWYYDAELEA